jgi:hypothetical protein
MEKIIRINLPFIFEISVFDGRLAYNEISITHSQSYLGFPEKVADPTKFRAWRILASVKCIRLESQAV